MSPSLTGGRWQVDGKALSRGALCHRPASVPPRQGGCRAGVRLLSPAPSALFCPRMGDTLPSTLTSPVGVLWGRSWTGHLGLHTRGAALSWRDGVRGLPSAPHPPLAPSPPRLASAPLHRWGCSRLWGHREAFPTLDTRRRRADHRARAGSQGKLQGVRPKERRDPTAHGAFLGTLGSTFPHGRVPCRVLCSLSFAPYGDL